MEKKNGKLYILLVLIEAVLVFSLGIFGNKVAEKLDISTNIIIAGTVLLMCLLLALTIVRIKYEKGEEIVPNLSKHVLLGTITTVFPIAIIIGMVTGIVCLFLFGGTR